MSIKFKIEGFEKILKDIEKANGSMVSACESALRQSAKTMQTELTSSMREANVPNHLIDAMPNFEIERYGNTVVARVGYKKGTYDPKNLSDGYKVVFLNYGTPHRSVHGKMVAKGFIDTAKRKARPKIKKQQQQVFDKILERLKR